MKSKADITFVTLFCKFSDAYICKDVGVIPALLQQQYGYKSKIACYDDGNGLNYRNKYFPQLEIQYIKKRNSIFLAEILYVIRNAKKIDVLNMYHMSVEHLVCLNVYKIINPKGVAFLKLDLGKNDCEEHAKLNNAKKNVIRYLHRKIDIVSAESEKVCLLYKEIFHIEPTLIVNGFLKKKEISKLPKENIFLTVGRIGTKQKATEILLESFAQISSECDWELRIIGAIEEEFNEYIDLFFIKHPLLADRVVFTKEIVDKNELDKEYQKAKILVLPSRWEGSPIVLTESISSGCYTITSDQVLSFDEITNRGKYGMTFKKDNIEELASVMMKSIDIVNNNNLASQIEKYSRRFEWNNVIDEINKILYLQMKKK